MQFNLTDPTPLAPAGIAAVLRVIVNAIAVVAGCSRFGMAVPGHSRLHLVAPLQMYILRLGSRFARLMARLEAGTLAPPKPRARRARPETRPETRKNPRLRLPGGKAWIIRDLGWRGVNAAGGLPLLLARPEVAEIVAQYPQAQRMLRPLCHMLGITAACIPPLPRRPRKPRPQPAAKPRRLTRKQRQAILWYPNSEGKPMNLLPRRLPRD